MGGALPPTDPRILAMTEQQIDIEFEHMLIDKEERRKAEQEAGGGQVYVDDNYEAEEAEEERIDSKLFIEEPDFEKDEKHFYADLRKSENDDDDEWVDVEIDDDN